jgi:DNA-binding GntR family transcriptional regulator
LTKIYSILYQEHQKILRALEKRDGILAEKLIKGQLENSFDHLKSYLETGEAEEEKIDSHPLRNRGMGKFV